MFIFVFPSLQPVRLTETLRAGKNFSRVELIEVTSSDCPENDSTFQVEQENRVGCPPPRKKMKITNEQIVSNCDVTNETTKDSSHVSEFHLKSYSNNKNFCKPCVLNQMLESDAFTNANGKVVFDENKTLPEHNSKLSLCDDHKTSSDLLVKKCISNNVSSVEGILSNDNTLEEIDGSASKSMVRSSLVIENSHLSDDLLSDGVTETCPLKRKRRRKHNKRLKREKQRLRGIFLSENLAFASAEKFEENEKVVKNLEKSYLYKGSQLIQGDEENQILKCSYEREIDYYKRKHVPLVGEVRTVSKKTTGKQINSSIVPFEGLKTRFDEPATVEIAALDQDNHEGNNQIVGCSKRSLQIPNLDVSTIILSDNAMEPPALVFDTVRKASPKPVSSTPKVDQLSRIPLKNYFLNAHSTMKFASDELRGESQPSYELSTENIHTELDKGTDSAELCALVIGKKMNANLEQITHSEQVDSNLCVQILNPYDRLLFKTSNNSNQSNDIPSDKTNEYHPEYKSLDKSMSIQSHGALNTSMQNHNPCIPSMITQEDPLTAMQELLTAGKTVEFHVERATHKVEFPLTSEVLDTSFPEKERERVPLPKPFSPVTNATKSLYFSLSSIENAREPLIYYRETSHPGLTIKHKVSDEHNEMDLCIFSNLLTDSSKELGNSASKCSLTSKVCFESSVSDQCKSFPTVPSYPNNARAANVLPAKKDFHGPENIRPLKEITFNLQENDINHINNSRVDHNKTDVNDNSFNDLTNSNPIADIHYSVANIGASQMTRSEYVGDGDITRSEHVGDGDITRSEHVGDGDITRSEHVGDGDITRSEHVGESQCLRVQSGVRRVVSSRPRVYSSIGGVLQRLKEQSNSTGNSAKLHLKLECSSVQLTRPFVSESGCEGVIIPVHGEDAGHKNECDTDSRQHLRNESGPLASMSNNTCERLPPNNTGRVQHSIRKKQNKILLKKTLEPKTDSRNFGLDNNLEMNESNDGNDPHYSYGDSYGDGYVKSKRQMGNDTSISFYHYNHQDATEILTCKANSVKNNMNDSKIQSNEIENSAENTKFASKNIRSTAVIIDNLRAVGSAKNCDEIIDQKQEKKRGCRIRKRKNKDIVLGAAPVPANIFEDNTDGHVGTAPTTLWDVTPMQYKSITDLSHPPYLDTAYERQTCNAKEPFCTPPFEDSKDRQLLPCISDLDVDSYPALGSSPRVNDIIYFRLLNDRRRCIRLVQPDEIDDVTIIESESYSCSSDLGSNVSNEVTTAVDVLARVIALPKIDADDRVSLELISEF